MPSPADSIARAAELAEIARRRALRDRTIAAAEEPQSEWRVAYLRAAEIHVRAQDLQSAAVTRLLRLRAVRDQRNDARAWPTEKMGSRQPRGRHLVS
jgi:hypothetical protein